MKLVIGCPVYDRNWILPDWFKSTFLALELAGISGDDVTFAFVTDDDDEETHEVVFNNSRGCALIFSTLSGRHHGERIWCPERYDFMVDLRNCLLDTVRLVEPEYFLSLDSDMLLHPEQLKMMFESIEKFDAVGGKAFMTPLGTGQDYPSYAMLLSLGGLKRENFYGVARVDVIMAIKLMNRVAYNVDYVTDFRGEDIGWSIAAREFGCTLGFDGRVTAKHVMEREHLTIHDERCGF